MNPIEPTKNVTPIAGRGADAHWDANDATAKQTDPAANRTPVHQVSRSARMRRSCVRGDARDIIRFGRCGPRRSAARLRAMTRALTIIAILAAGLLTACGESSEEKAQTTVCDARADISAQVDDLKAITPATFSTDAVSKSLSAIQSDLSDIRGAQSDLSDDRRQQVEDATKTFTSSVEGS